MGAALDHLVWQGAIVAVLSACLWALPIKGRWPLWHHSIGLALVALVGAVTALRAGDVEAFPGGALQGMAGLGVSWLLIESVILARAAGQRLTRQPPRVQEPDE